jgi:hypothetical protein
MLCIQCSSRIIVCFMLSYTPFDALHGLCFCACLQEITASRYDGSTLPAFAASVLCAVLCSSAAFSGSNAVLLDLLRFKWH